MIRRGMHEVGEKPAVIDRPGGLSSSRPLSSSHDSTPDAPLSTRARPARPKLSSAPDARLPWALRAQHTFVHLTVTSPPTTAR